MPSPSLSPEQSVKVQLDALSSNDEPWPNHGIQTAYEFALDAGGMDPAYYFGQIKDLYHYDHFMGMFGNRLKPLISNQQYEVLSVKEAQPGLYVVLVSVVDGTGSPAGTYRFELKQRELGRKKGAWMTHMLIKHDDV